jgi:hypothetical protein
LSGFVGLRLEIPSHKPFELSFWNHSGIILEIVGFVGLKNDNFRTLATTSDESSATRSVADSTA